MRRTKTPTTRGYLSPDRYLSIEQVQRLRRCVRQLADTARRRGTTRALTNEMLVELMLETGLRGAEVCRLQLRDLPTYHGKDVVLVRSGKGGILRTVVVKPSMKARLREFIKTARKNAKPGSSLFVSERGYRVVHDKKFHGGKLIEDQEHSARLTYQSLYYKIKRIGDKAGIPGLHPHVLRHTYATHLHAVEHDLRFVQDALGHSRPETTARYARVLDEARRRQVEQLYSRSDSPSDSPNV